MLLLVARLAPINPALDPTALAALTFELNGQPWNLTVPIMSAPLGSDVDTVMGETLELEAVRRLVRLACHEPIMCLDSPTTMAGTVVRALTPSQTWSALRERIEAHLFEGFATMLPDAEDPKPWHVPAMLLDLDPDAAIDAPPQPLRLVEFDIIEVYQQTTEAAA